MVELVQKCYWWCWKDSEGAINSATVERSQKRRMPPLTLLHLSDAGKCTWVYNKRCNTYHLFFRKGVPRSRPFESVPRSANTKAERKARQTSTWEATLAVLLLRRNRPCSRLPQLTCTSPNSPPTPWIGLSLCHTEHVDPPASFNIFESLGIRGKILNQGPGGLTLRLGRFSKLFRFFCIFSKHPPTGYCICVTRVTLKGLKGRGPKNVPKSP